MFPISLEKHVFPNDVGDRQIGVQQLGGGGYAHHLALSESCEDAMTPPPRRWACVVSMARVAEASGLWNRAGGTSDLLAFLICTPSFRSVWSCRRPCPYLPGPWLLGV